MTEILTAKEVAARLKISRAEVYHLHHQGKLRASYKLFEDSERGLRWTEEDIEKYLGSSKLEPRLSVLEELKSRRSRNFRGTKMSALNHKY